MYHGSEHALVEELEKQTLHSILVSGEERHRDAHLCLINVSDCGRERERNRERERERGKSSSGRGEREREREREREMAIQVT